jgi:hypothetical protein
MVAPPAWAEVCTDYLLANRLDEFHACVARQSGGAASDAFYSDTVVDDVIDATAVNEELVALTQRMFDEGLKRGSNAAGAAVGAAEYFRDLLGQYAEREFDRKFGDYVDRYWSPALRQTGGKAARDALAEQYRALENSSLQILREAVMNGPIRFDSAGWRTKSARDAVREAIDGGMKMLTEEFRDFWSDK